MIKKILVPVDGSAHSVKAAELASDLAVKYGAEIVLLHVLLRGHMPEGLKKAIEIEVGTQPGTGTGHLVNIPQQIMARVQDKRRPNSRSRRSTSSPSMCSRKSPQCAVTRASRR